MDTLVTMFSMHCADPCTIEACEVVYPNGEKIKYPELKYRKEKILPLEANNYIGVKLVHWEKNAMALFK